MANQLRWRDDPNIDILGLRKRSIPIKPIENGIPIEDIIKKSGWTIKGCRPIPPEPVNDRPPGNHWEWTGKGWNNTKYKGGDDG